MEGGGSTLTTYVSRSSLGQAGYSSYNVGPLPTVFEERLRQLKDDGSDMNMNKSKGAMLARPNTVMLTNGRRSKCDNGPTFKDLISQVKSQKMTAAYNEDLT